MLTLEQLALLNAYEKAPIVTERHRYAWDALCIETCKLFVALPSDLRVRFMPGQPYATAADLHKVYESRYLVISTDYCEHPVWEDEVNLRFRAVHDYYGHILTGFDFTLEGEYNAYLATAKLHTPSAAHALFTEVYVQALYQTTLGNFPKQKVVLL